MEKIGAQDFLANDLMAFFELISLLVVYIDVLVCFILAYVGYIFDARNFCSRNKPVGIFLSELIFLLPANFSTLYISCTLSAMMVNPVQQQLSPSSVTNPEVSR